MYIRTLGADPEALAAAFTQLDIDGDGSLNSQGTRKATEEYCTSEDPQAPSNWLFGSFS
ncbi:hypothetical protein [Streptomyces purpurogeneiscleroticus]|uniref:hypothetical protein n=1 Tax=Streptomyces purpurogeneiscleroticus TaxID=68259 RepID=UPI001CC110DB|nr:hypothetical protein [Streptomyces purpurogeneiscleroticus]